MLEALKKKKRKKNSQDINCDKTRKTKIGFVPSVINRNFGRYETIQKKQFSFFVFPLFLQIFSKLFSRYRERAFKSEFPALKGFRG